MAWQKQGSTTKTSAGSNIEVDPDTPTKFNQFLFHNFRSTNTQEKLTLNNDGGMNYSNRSSKNGGGDDPVADDTKVQTQSENEDDDGFTVGYFINISSEEKLGIVFNIDRRFAGAGTAPQRREIVFKHVNTASQDDQIDYDTTAGNWNIDTNLTVLGTD